MFCAFEQYLDQEYTENPFYEMNLQPEHKNTPTKVEPKHRIKGFSPQEIETELQMTNIRTSTPPKAEENVLKTPKTPEELPNTPLKNHNNLQQSNQIIKNKDLNNLEDDFSFKADFIETQEDLDMSSIRKHSPITRLEKTPRAIIHEISQQDPVDHQTPKKKAKAKKKKRNNLKYLNNFQNWQKQKDLKLDIARKYNRMKEMEEIKPFRCKSTNKLPLGYVNPIEKLKLDRDKKLSNKRLVNKPPIGKPEINKKSRRLAKKIHPNGTKIWERMYSYSQKNLHSNLSFNLSKDSSENNILQFTKPSRNNSHSRNRKEKLQGACNRLYNQALKHHKYIDEKMKEKGTQNVRFVNKSSDRIVGKMATRKPLYFVPEVKENSNNIPDLPVKDLKNLPLPSNEFMDRNYNIHLRKLKEMQEIEENKLTELYSETGFIPIIDKKSKLITEDREANSQDIHKSLYEDYKYKRDKQKAMEADKSKRLNEEESIQTTFHPSITHYNQEEHYKYVDPKKYLHLERDKSYTEIYHREKMIESKSMHTLQPSLSHQKLHNQIKGLGNQDQIGSRCNLKGCFSKENLDINEHPPSSQIDDGSSAQSLIINESKSSNQTSFPSTTPFHPQTLFPSPLKDSSHYQIPSPEYNSRQEYSQFFDSLQKMRDNKNAKPSNEVDENKNDGGKCIINPPHPNQPKASSIQATEAQAQDKENNQLDHAPEIIQSIVQMEDNFVSFLDHTYE
ncbi:unnamed protein product [Moneuplotes crassus]|uniref:Uncharacterized protein n=1 Tax=Euplotes crassus TaxID=5936 RepID=A0AAD1Y402_EUPCR|nr:unnamed protein product [Moneuplotes crassus]